MWASVFSTIDTNVLLVLNNLSYANSVWFGFASFCAHYLIYVLIIAAIIYLLEHHDYRLKSPGSHVFAQALLAVILASAIGFMISVYIGRPRPYFQFIDVSPIGSVPNSNSFPSAHAWIAFAFTSVFIFYHRYAKMGYALVFGAFLVALGRVMAGMHYPSDVVVGGLLGFVSAYGVVRYSNQLFKWLARWAIDAPKERKT